MPWTRSTPAIRVRGTLYRHLAVTFVSNGTASFPNELPDLPGVMNSSSVSTAHFRSAANKRSRSGLCSALSERFVISWGSAFVCLPSFLLGMFRVFLGGFRAFCYLLYTLTVDPTSLGGGFEETRKFFYFSEPAISIAGFCRYFHDIAFFAPQSQLTFSSLS